MQGFVKNLEIFLVDAAGICELDYLSHEIHTDQRILLEMKINRV